jgi:hypothetical protein
MNGEELGRNPQLTDFEVHDLNTDPKLPYPDNSFDVITNCVSVDYLNQPIEVGRRQGAAGGCVWAGCRGRGGWMCGQGALPGGSRDCVS